MEHANKIRPVSVSWFQSSLIIHVLLVTYICIVVCVPGRVSGGELPQDYLPQIQILEIISTPINRSTSVNLWKDRNSDVIIGEDTSATSRILMKCNATYPVQWVYLGDGRPEFTTFTNVKWQEDTNVPLSFEAEASLGLLGFQGVLREDDSGNYTCRSIQEPTVNSYYYIFVPGDGLFAAGNETNITYAAKDQYIRIPCGVSHPKTNVTLCKKDKNDKLSCPVTGASGFNTKGGFLINLKKQRSPSGTYICTANYQGTVRIAEHQVMREDEKPKEPAPAPPPPTFTTNPGKNICDPSPCGKQADCTVVNGRAVCYCFRGLSGNPYDECAPGKCRSSKECPRGKFCRQGQCTSDPCNPSPCGKGGQCTLFRGQSKCSCQRGFTGLPPNCVKSCTQNEQCAQDEACIKAICQSPCPGPCGQNAECRTLLNGAQRTAQCSCPNGFLGDPLRICYKFNSTTPGPWNNCPPGYVGIPPACQRRECIRDVDCPFGRKCIKSICDTGAPPVCPGKCGINAQCVISPTSSSAICICPNGLTGDPAIHCVPPGATPTSYHNPPPTSWGDPCMPNPCNSPAECHFVQGSRKCLCPPGTTGDPSNCIPATSPTYPSSSSTTGGTHVYCRYDAECKPGENCVEGHCKDPCHGICGYNAVCQPAYERKYRSIFATGKLLRAQQPESACACPPGLEGNPYVSCIPMRTGPTPPFSPSPHDGHSPFPNDGYSPFPTGSQTPFPTDGHSKPPKSDGYSPFPTTDRSPFPSTGRSPFPTDGHTPIHSKLPNDGYLPFPTTGHSPFPSTGRSPFPTDGHSRFPDDGHSRFPDDGHSKPPKNDGYSPFPTDRHSPFPTDDHSPFPNDDHSPFPTAGRSPFPTAGHSTFPTDGHSTFPTDGHSTFPSDRHSPSPPLPRPTQARTTPHSPSELDHQGHSWGHHIDIKEPSFPPSRNLYGSSIGGSRFSSRHDLAPTSPMSPHSDRSYYPPPSSTVYEPDNFVDTRPSQHPTTAFHMGDSPTPKTLAPPMSPLAPLAPPMDERDECSFRNPYADYDMNSCGLGRRCERDFRGIKRCVCISPFDCTGPTSTYARNKCQTSRDCLLSDHICMNGTCENPCSPEYSPCAGIAYSECRVIEGNVLCTCRRGYIGNPSSGLDCRPKSLGLPTSGSVHNGYHNGTSEYVIITNGHANYSSNNFSATADYDDNNSIINDDGHYDDDDIIIGSGSTGVPGSASTARHHRRHDKNHVKNADKLNFGSCGFGSGQNCDEKSHCLIVNGRPMCVCKVGYHGEYPNCKPECEKNEDCQDGMACQYHQCMDPCIEEKSYCATNAFCRVVNHSARCECGRGYVGVPWIQCSKAGDAPRKNDCMGFNCQKRRV